MNTKYLSLLFCLLTISVFAQDRKIAVPRTSEHIHIDGTLNEHVWDFNSSKADHFTQNFPTDTAPAKSPTQVLMCYDHKCIYIAAKCYDTLPGKYIVQSYRRDFENKVNDMLAITLNPSGDGLNGFNFSVNPLNVQREGTIDEGGLFGVTTAWDTRWFSATKRYDSFWVAEMAIPFKSIRYGQDSSGNWRINFSRNDLKRNEVSCWIPVSRNYNISNLGTTGKVVFEGGHPPKISNNLVLIPFAYWQAGKDFSKDASSQKLRGGLDAKVALNTSLNMDITLNPDFSQVEVDRQITNLSRFNIFYPERRNFFIENGDLFANFGFSRIRPFFSRRIGLDDNGNMIPILYGLKISGKAADNWRIGILNNQTLPTANRTAQNYLIAATQYNIYKRNTLGIIMMNRNGWNHEGAIDSDYNRIVGADYNINSMNNRWRGKIFYHYSLFNHQKSDAGATAMWLSYNYSHWNIAYNHEYVGKNYRSDVGYIYRQDYFRHEDWVYYSFFPKSNTIFQHGPGIYSDLYLDRNGKFTDRTLSPSYKVTFKSGAVLTTLFNNNFVRLTSDFDPSGSGKGLKFHAGDSFTYNNFSSNYISDGRKLFRYTIAINQGGYFNGSKFTYSADLSYRFPPYLTLGCNLEQNFITLPALYRSNVLNLLGARADVTLTRSIYFTTYLQYNSQTNNININSRLQWRFAPVSDFYIVYTDNYTADFRTAKNRYLILKLSYYLGL